MFAPDVTAPARLDHPHPDQAHAVTDRRRSAPRDRRCRRAGSGKTRTLASRVAWLIDQGTPAERILLLTFTRRAPPKWCAGPGRSSPIGRQAGYGAGRSTPSPTGCCGATPWRWGSTPTTPCSTSPTPRLCSACCAPSWASGRARCGSPRKETIAAIYSRTVNEQAKLDDVLRLRFPWCQEHGEGLRSVFKAYRVRKREHNVLDYDDLLLYWRALVESPAAGAVKGLFDHVLVDEFQDTNHIQGDILAGMCGAAGNLTVVGDDAQAIYSFRAASIDNIRGFADDYSDVEVVALEENYRSTPQILEAANAVIAESKELYPKRLRSSRPMGPLPDLVTCFDEGAQADFVCDTVLAHREAGIPLRDQAVLFRTGHHSDGLELELARRNIPFVKYGGLKFLEAAHVKDLLALLRILDNPRDQLAWHRALLAIPGVGPATAARLLEGAAERSSADGFDLMTAFCTLDPTLGADALQPFAELQRAMRDARGTPGKEPAPSEQIDRLLPFCAMVFERNYDDAAARLGDIEQLGALAGQYPHAEQVPHRADPRSAGLDRRSRRPTAPRRRLPRALDHPLGQGR